MRGRIPYRYRRPNKKRTSRITRAFGLTHGLVTTGPVDVEFLARARARSRKPGDRTPAEIREHIPIFLRAVFRPNGSTSFDLIRVTQSDLLEEVYRAQLPKLAR